MNTVQKIIIGYYLIINLLLFILMGYDKMRAKKDQWRVPEATLFFLAVLGGGLGGLIGMNTFRHKTQHISFWLLFGVSVILHLVLFWFVLRGFLFAAN